MTKKFLNECKVENNFYFSRIRNFGYLDGVPRDDFYREITINHRKTRKYKLDCLKERKRGINFINKMVEDDKRAFNERFLIVERKFKYVSWCIYMSLILYVLSDKIINMGIFEDFINNNRRQDMFYLSYFSYSAVFIIFVYGLWLLLSLINIYSKIKNAGMVLFFYKRFILNIDQIMLEEISTINEALSFFSTAISFILFLSLISFMVLFHKN